MHIHRLATIYNVDVDQLPQDLQVLSSLDLEAIRDGKAFFMRAAENTKIDWMRKIFERCAKSGWWLEFLSVEESPYLPFFRFNWGPAICLSRGVPVRDDMPEFLRNVYASIEGLQLAGHDESGGLNLLDVVCSIEESGVWISEEDSSGVDPARAIGFLSDYTGDRLCYLLDGGAAWKSSSGHFERVEDLEKEVATFFESKLT
jgi:hypothetical protein